MDIQEYRRARLLSAIVERFSGNKSAFGRAIGHKDGSFVGQMLRAERPIKEDTIQKVESLMGLKGWFSKPEKGGLPHAANVTGYDRTTVDSTDPQPVALTDNPEYPAVPLVKMKLSAGASGFGVEYLDYTARPMVFHRDWYESNGFSPAKLFAIFVTGESMQPGLWDGDTVVVNTADVTPADGVVFAVNYEGELVIKRLVRDDGAWWLVSDNQDQRRYPRKRVHEDSFLIGRVVHKQSERI